jgi:N-acetylornithine carbamoyltransferase
MIASAPSPRHFLSPSSFALDETRDLLRIARELRARPIRDALAGRSLGLVFFDSSLRTRTTFEIGMQQLGGMVTTLNVGAGVWNLEYRDGVVMDGPNAEHVADAARVLSRVVDVLGVRAFPRGATWAEDSTDPIVGSFARYAQVPLINAESALYHPCQSLADLMTIEDRLGDPKRQPIAITWAWHPRQLPMAVPNSILLEAAKFGMEIRLAHPPGWELDPTIMAEARATASAAGGSVSVHRSMDEAMDGARVVYAKSWGSIARYRDDTAETAAKKDLRDQWRVTEARMDRTRDGFFMHCLPVRRNVIVDDAVLDSPRNAAYDEAENRLHVQKALLLNLLGVEL